jgi:dihydrofolate reductase
MMGKVTTQFTMSLDGFIAGSNDEVDRIFKWYGSGDVDFPVEGSDMVFKVSQASADYLSEEWGQLGAIVTGRRDFDVSNAWGGETVFVTDGVESAIAQAREAAGDKNVSVGGTTIVQQCLKLGLIDEIRLDMAPVLLGEGIRLFDKLGPEPIELEQIGVIEGTGVTHVKYRVVK